MKLGEPYEDGGKWYRNVIDPKDGVDSRPAGIELKRRDGAWVECSSPGESSWVDDFEYRVPVTPPGTPDQPLPARGVNYATRVTQVTVSPKDARVFDERSTAVAIEDEGAGEYVTIHQPGHDAKIQIEAAEWPAIREAIDRMIQETRKGGE